MSDFATTLRAVMTAPELRRLSLACFAFNGLQTVFTSYFIILLTEAGYGLSLAGLVFSIAMMVAVPGRILWGWMGSSFVAPRAMMGALALGMAVSSMALAFFGAATAVSAAAVGGKTYTFRRIASACVRNTSLINSYASLICFISRAPVIITCPV